MILQIFGFLCYILTCALSDESSHSYQKNEAVIAWVNKIGPFNNPTETYPYYRSHVPFCTRSAEIEVSHDDFHYQKFDGLGSLLEGNQLVHSGIPIKFASNLTRTADCTMILTRKKANNLAQAIKEKYWYQMFIDDLPVWGMVGEYLPISSETAKHHHDNLAHVSDEDFTYDHLSGKYIATFPHIFTHKSFSLSFNGNQIIEVNLTSEDPVLVKTDTQSKTEPQSVKMTYSVHWFPTNKNFNKRFERYLDFQFFEHQIHWFAIFNSFMLVIFLVGMVSMILFRALKRDYDRYAAEEDNDLDYDAAIEETGWKKLHGDVFRRPHYLPVFSAVVGTGYQLYTSVLLVILLAISGRVYDTRGTVATASISTYAVTSLVGGYTTAQTFLDYSKKEDPEWKIAMALNGLLLPSIVFAVTFCLNILSVSYQATNAIGFGTFSLMIFIWGVSLVLLFVGTLVGRATHKGADWPCAVNPNFIRPIPDDRPFWMKPIVYCSVVGLLPFGSIFIEMYYIFNSFWNYKFYYVYGFMLLVFIILTIVTGCVTIVATYVRLNTEDRRWKWTAVFSGGSTALYVFAYAIIYFQTKTQMSGLFQTSFYFGYMFLFSLAVFFVCGTVGYAATAVFVKRIYAGIHTD